MSTEHGWKLLGLVAFLHVVHKYKTMAKNCQDSSTSIIHSCATRGMLGYIALMISSKLDMVYRWTHFHKLLCEHMTTFHSLLDISDHLGLPPTFSIFYLFLVKYIYTRRGHLGCHIKMNENWVGYYMAISSLSFHIFLYLTILSTDIAPLFIV